MKSFETLEYNLLTECVLQRHLEALPKGSKIFLSIKRHPTLNPKESTMQNQADHRSIWGYLDNLSFTQGYIDAAGVKTRYVQAGAKDAPPLIMIHGMGGSWENFTANFAEHAKHFNTFAFDLAGHGYSGKPDKVFAVEDYVAQLEGFMDAQKLERVSLFGLSIGGWISTKFTLRHPERVDKLTVLSAWGRPRAVETPESKERLRKSLADRLDAVDNPSWEGMDRVFAGLIADPKDRMPDLLALRLRLYRQPGMAKTMRNVFAGLSPEVWDRNMLTDDELKSVSRPTMVIACVDHPDVFLTSAYEYKALIPGVKFVELKGASHWPQWECPDECNRINIDFLQAG
jgi:2-hydroxy-6-oxonona-2,4-dienedioate hydrolase